MFFSLLFRFSFCDNFIANHTERIVFIQDSSAVVIKDCDFESLATFLRGGAISLSSPLNITISNARFFNCSADKGGATYLMKQNYFLASSLCVKQCHACLGQVFYLEELAHTKNFSEISIENCPEKSEDSLSICYFYGTTHPSDFRYVNTSRCHEQSFLPLRGTFHFANLTNIYFTIFDSISSKDLLIFADSVRICNVVFVNNTVRVFNSKSPNLVYSIDDMVLTNVTFKDNDSKNEKNVSMYISALLSNITVNNCFSDQIAEGLSNYSFHIVPSVNIPFNVTLNCVTPMPYIKNSNILTIVLSLTISISVILMLIATIYACKMRKAAQAEHEEAELTRSLLQNPV